jgi:hypothetical protein
VVGLVTVLVLALVVLPVVIGVFLVMGIVLARGARRERDR